MKRVILMMASFLLCFISVAEGAHWIRFVSPPSGGIYYDSESITYPAEDIVRVWNKQIYSDEGRKDLERHLGAKALDASENNNLFEFNCRTREFKIISGMIYTFSDEILYSDPDTPTNWLQVAPNTNIEVIYTIVCKKMMKKK